MLYSKHLKLLFLTFLTFSGIARAQTEMDTICWHLKSAVFENDSVRLTEILNTHPDITDCWSYDEPTALNYAIQNGNFGITELLLANGANPDGPFYLDYPPLHLAVMQGMTSIAELIILYGATLNNTDIYGFTPLTRAIQTGDLWMADMLIHYGAEIDEKDGEGYTPLDIAAIYNDTLLTAFLLEKGAIQTTHAMGIAICAGSSEVIKLLLPLIPDSTRHLLINYSVIQNNKTALTIMKNHGITPSLKPLIASWTFKQHHSWSGKDMFLGWNFGIREMRYNTRISAGFHFRTKPAVIVYDHPSKPTFYQLNGSRNFLFIEAEKHFTLWQQSNQRYHLCLGGKAGYAGGQFAGTIIKPEQGFRTAFHTSLVMETRFLQLSAGYLRNQFKDSPIPQGRFFIEAGFFIPRNISFTCPR